MSQRNLQRGIPAVWLVWLACAGLVSPPAGAAPAPTPTLVDEFDLNGNLNDSLGHGTLTANGGTAGAGFLAFTRQSGPTLSVNSALAGNYSIALLFSLSDPAGQGFNGWVSLVNFNNLQSDTNNQYLYLGQPDFYQMTSPGPDTVQSNVVVQMVFTRDGASGAYNCYLNGNLENSFIDSQTGAVAVIQGGSAIFQLFQDDLIFYTNYEASAGTLYAVKVWQGALAASQVPYAFTNYTAQTTNADLQIGKMADTTAVGVGGEVMFTLTAQNGGPANVTNAIVVTDCLPPGFQYVTDSTVGNSSNGVYSPGTCLWTLPAGLAWGASTVLTITATATTNGVFTNTATIAVPSGYTDPDFGNNTSSWVVTITNSAPAPVVSDLQVIKSASTNSVRLGQPVVFAVDLENLGPDYVSNDIVTTDCLPVGYQYVTDNTVGGTGINGSYSPGTCLWTLSGGLGTNFIVHLRITAVATSTGVFTNTATVAVPPGVTDPNLANNTGSVTVTNTQPVADLQITQTASTNVVQAGQPVDFIMSLRNLGPDYISNDIVTTDCLPAGYQYVTDNTIGGGGINGTYSPGTCLWTLSGGLGTNFTVILQITAQATSLGVYTNTATVAVPQGINDPNLANNSASVMVTNVAYVAGYVRGCQTNGVPIAQVAMSLSGAATRTIVTDTNGFYLFTNLPGGNYNLYPSQPGNLFTPAGAGFLLVSNTTLAPFVGSIGLIQGYLRYSTNGTGVSGLPVNLTGAQTRMVLSDANGYYVFTNTPAGNYTVTPAATNGFIFAPTNQAVKLSGTNCVARADFVSQSRTVLLVALEVVQVIQDWNNSVRLIQGKETYVRAHFQVTSNNPVLLQGAQLFNGAAAISPVPPSTLLVSWTNAAARPIREQLTNSLLFRLPAGWLAGTVNLRFACTNNVTVIPTNVVPANGTVRVSFTPAPPLPVKIYPVNWTNAAGAVQQVAANNLADVPRRLLSMYPVPSVDAEPAPPLIMTNRAPPPYPQINARLAANRVLDWLSGFAFRVGFPPPNQRLYHGAVAGATVAAWGRGDSGLADGIPGSSSSGLMPPNNDFYAQLFLRHLAAHEIGHNLGRPHTASAALFGSTAAGDPLGGCGETAAAGTVYPLYQSVAGLYANRPALGPMNNGTNSLIYGLDTLTYRTAPQYNPIASPYVYFDVMSYCGVLPLSWWISTYNYTNIYNYVTNNFAGPPGGRPAPGPGTNWMVFRGLVDYTLNSAQFLPTLAVDSSILPPSPPAGGYALFFFDLNGNLLGEIPFQPGTDEAENGDDQTGSFLIPVPADSAIHEVALWNGTNFIADLIGSTNRPYAASVTLSATNGGSFLGAGQMNIQWLGGDADPNALLSYTIEYSPDNGATWETLAADWPGQSYALDSQVLPASAQGLVRVIASDGLDSSVPAESGSFAILPHPPTVLLNAPMNQAMFIADEQIFLDASVYDSQDGPLDGNSVQWSSSRDGALGSGAVLNLEADRLSEGTHLVTVTATDSDGLSNSATMQIFVLRQPPPQLAIEQSGDQMLLSWPSSVTNYVLESSASLAPANWTAVTNAPVAADAQQTVTMSISGETAFFRLRLLQ